MKAFLTAYVLMVVVTCLNAAPRPHNFNRYREEEIPLAAKHRESLGRIEHRALILNSKAFPRLARQVRERKEAELLPALHKAFRGTVLDSEPLMRNEMVEVRRKALGADGDGTGRAADRAAFVAYLSRLREAYAESPRVSWAVMGLSPVGGSAVVQTTGWRGTALFEIRGRRIDGSLGETVLELAYDLATIPPPESVETTEEWIRGLRVTSIQETVARGLLFKETARERSIDPGRLTDTWKIFPAQDRPVVTGGVFLGDVDNDDLEDILITDTQGVFLFLNQADGGFREVTGQMGLPQGLKGIVNAAFGDFDNDGFLDLLLDYRAYRNERGQRFVEVTQRTGFRFPNATGFTVVDYDRDGLLDVYVSRYYGLNLPLGATNSWFNGPGGPGNQLWRNLGDWRFEEVTRPANAAAGRRSCFTTAWLDANNDGWPDAYVINEFGGGVLLLNTGRGTFEERPLTEDPGDFGAMGLAVADFDNDGWIDVYSANMYSKSGRRVIENLPEGSYAPKLLAAMKRFVTGSELYRNNGGMKFERLGRSMSVHRVGWAYGPAFIDLDNDGFLDLYGTAGFASVTRDEPDG